MRMFEVTRAGHGAATVVRFRLVGVPGQLYDAEISASVSGVEIEGGWPVLTAEHAMWVAEHIVYAAAAHDQIASGRTAQFDEAWLREANR